MNKNLKRRTIALLLALVMVLSMLAGCKNEESGEIASEDDTVMPEMPRYTMSRAEFITRLNDFFGFVKTSKDEFTDVLKDDAFYEDVAKAVGVGYMRPDEENNIRPGDLMSVNDSVLSFSTVLDKDPSEVWETLFQNTDVTLKPSDEEGLDTTSLETMLDRILEGDNAVDGDYGIISSGETLSNKFVTGDVNIENSVGDGFTEITDVLAKQSLNINGGGRDKGVLLDSVHTPLMNIDRPQGTVAVTLDGETYIDETAIYSPCIIVEKPSLEDDGIRNMTVPEDAPDNMTVSFTGDADEILLESPTDLQIISGRQKVVHIRESASGTKIFIDSNAIIDKLIIEGKVDVTGNGTIIEAEVLTDEDISFEKDPDKVTSGKNPDGTDKPLVLSKTKNLTVSLINGRYIVSWNKVFGADSYDVQIFRKEQKFDLKNTAELKLDITDEISRGGVATYRVEVTAKGDGKTTSEPMSSDSFDYKISLKTPENITLEISGGKATGRWDASADAKKYTVELYKGSKKIYNTETSGTTIDLTKQMTESGPGLYSIKVGATGADNYYINSPKGSSKAVEYNIKLDTPTELELVETTKEFYVKWTASANAKKYRVELYRENKQIVQETVTKTTWDITKYVQENGSGKYYYTVYAEGYGYYLSSDKAKSTEYQLTSTLASPQEIIFNTEEGNIVLQWRPVLNSTSYDVTLLRNGKVVDEQKLDANTTQIDYTELIDNLGVAVYQAKIIANGGPGDLPSDPGFSNEYKHKIRLNTPTNLIFDEMFYSFFAEWDVVPEAYGYRILVYRIEPVYVDNETGMEIANPDFTIPDTNVSVKEYRETFIRNYDVTETKLEITKEIKALGGGEYKIKVVAKPKAGDPNFIESLASDFSQSQTYRAVIESPRSVDLKINTDDKSVYFGETTASWDAVEGAAKYQLTLVKKSATGEVRYPVPERYISGLTADLTDAIRASGAGKYYLEVSAVPKDSTFYDPSTPTKSLEVQCKVKLPTPRDAQILETPLGPVVGTSSTGGERYSYSGSWKNPDWGIYDENGNYTGMDMPRPDGLVYEVVIKNARNVTINNTVSLLYDSMDGAVDGGEQRVVDISQYVSPQFGDAEYYLYITLAHSDTESGNADYIRSEPIISPLYHYYPSAFAYFPQGSGNEGNPFVINDLQGLKNISKYPLASYILGSNIDCGGEEIKAIGEENTATTERAFMGHLDGDGHIITGYRVSQNASGGTSNLGLFGVLSTWDFTIPETDVRVTQTGTIENLAISNVFVEVENGDNIGSLVGKITNGIVRNVTAMDVSVAGANYVGGVIGYVQTDLTANEPTLIDQITVSSSNENAYYVRGRKSVGGVIGAIESGEGTRLVNQSLTVKPQIEDLNRANYPENYGGIIGLNRGTILGATNKAQVGYKYANGGTTYTGGIAGKNEGTIGRFFETEELYTDNENFGKITGYSYIGGIAGTNAGAGTITNAFNVYDTNDASGEIKGFYCIGGIAGQNIGRITLTHNIADIAWSELTSGGSLPGVAQDATGGLVGDNKGSILQSYNSGKVMGIVNVGGVAGRNVGTLENVYNRGEISGSQTVGGLVGANTKDIRYAFNKGATSASLSTPLGAIAGNNSGGRFTNVYYDLDIANGATGIGAGRGEGITGLSENHITVGESGNVSTNQWIDALTFENFMFNVIWNDPTVNGAYPTLQGNMDRDGISPSLINGAAAVINSAGNFLMN